MSAAATRAVGTVVAGRRVEACGGKQRLSRQAWQDVRRACRLAAESECVRAVDIHGVHISFVFLLRLFAMETIWVAAPLKRGKHQQLTRCRRKSDLRGRQFAAAAEHEAAGKIQPWQKGGS